jgi:hypothetical protein
MRGLDPRIHLLKTMDCRVKPGNDNNYLSFRGDAKQRTRNLEIPGLVLRTIPE